MQQVFGVNVIHKTALWWFLLCVLLTSPLQALRLKVISVDHEKGRIQALLPMHHATIEASLAPEEPEIRVKVNEFYEAKIISGKVNTTERNYLRIKIPNQKPAKFRLRKISFLGL